MQEIVINIASEVPAKRLAAAQQYLDSPAVVGDASFNGYYFSIARDENTWCDIHQINAYRAPELHRLFYRVREIAEGDQL